jgi:hypothetical protein
MLSNMLRTLPSPPLSDYASSPSSNSPPSKFEAMFYYSGISPYPPKLVYRTGGSKTPWSEPTGLESYRKLKQARGVFGHKLNAVWKDVGPLVRDLLKAQGVAWTSIDVVRFLTDGDGDEKIRGPVVLWVGVRPDSLQGEDAFRSGDEILSLLASFDIGDVEVEYRESVYKRSVGPALLRSVDDFDTTVDVRGPLTPALGLPIAASDRPDAQGTMALYFSEGGSSDKVLGLTCHHVLFKTDGETNDDYVFASAGAPRKHVQLLGTRAFEKLLASIKLHISHHGAVTKIRERQIRGLRAKVDDEAAEALVKDDSAVVGGCEQGDRGPREVLRQDQEGLGPAQAAHHRPHPLLSRHHLQRWSRRLYGGLGCVQARRPQVQGRVQGQLH